MPGGRRRGSATITGTDTAGRITAAAPELAARLASFVARERLPGAAAGVVCGDELAWLAGAGLADLATGKVTDPAMRYGIASVSVFFLDFTWVRLDRVTA